MRECEDATTCATLPGLTAAGLRQMTLASGLSTLATPVTLRLPDGVRTARGLYSRL
jgi:hypothetical protein